MSVNHGSAASPMSEMNSHTPSTGRSPAPLRLAVVGCGAVSKASLLPVLAGHDGVSIHALVDRNEQRARELADAYGIARVFTSADALTRDDVDGLVIATPPAHHAPAVMGAAARGLHAFVEKPMAMDAADARAMVDACARAGVVLSVGLYRRFLPSVQLLREILDRFADAEYLADAEDARLGSGSDLGRTPAQRRFDALKAIFLTAAAGAPGVIGSDPLVNIVLDQATAEELLSELAGESVERPPASEFTRRRCETIDGDPLSHEAALAADKRAIDMPNR